MVSTSSDDFKPWDKFQDHSLRKECQRFYEWLVNFSNHNRPRPIDEVIRVLDLRTSVFEDGFDIKRGTEITDQVIEEAAKYLEFSEYPYYGRLLRSLLEPRASVS